MARTNTLGNFLTDIANAIREKKGTTNAISASDFDTQISSIETNNEIISCSKKDVNFYDYDGTITNSYTKEEFLSLIEMPSNPTHGGLISEGWNWNLSDAQTYVTNYDKLNIGQTYITDDGATRLYIELTEGHLSPYITVAASSYQYDVKIDWGDGEQSIQTSSSIGSYPAIGHTYNKPGSYVISMQCVLEKGYSADDTEEGYIYFIGGNSASLLLHNNTQEENNNGQDENMIYRSSIRKIEIGSNVRTIGSEVFKCLFGLETITIPSYFNMLWASFKNCYSLKHINLPSTMTTFYDYLSFINCRGLKSITLPHGITNIGGSRFMETHSLSEINGFSSVNSLEYTFNGAYNLSYLILPNTISEIGQYSFRNCLCLKYIDFTHFTSIPVINSTSQLFESTPKDMVLLVPYSLCSKWKSSTNWSDFSSQIVGKALGSELGNINDTLPTTDNNGAAITWYSDKYCKTSVTTINNLIDCYYCKNSVEEA